MPITNETFTRRQALGGLGAGVAMMTVPGCATLSQDMRAQGTGIDPHALLDEIAYNLLTHEPERATTLGVDVGAHAALRGRLKDLTPQGIDAYAATLRTDLNRVRAVDTSVLDAATRTSFEVVESAYATALDGFAQPYGDVAVGSWRNTPYVVIQNVGGYIDFPRFFDSDQPVRDAADADAYLSRLEAVPAALEGELERVRAAAARGLIPPAFLLAKAIPQMEASLADAHAGGTLVDALARKTAEANLSGDWAARAKPIATGPIAAALERQLAELKRQQPLATDDAGTWARPDGDEWYAWGLRASTTTRMTPEEIHEMGLTQLDEIHGRMDPILRDLGYTQGSVGDRMTALGEDPRFKFADGDPGRAEIMAFIQERIAWIRAQMPRAFSTVVRADLEVRRLPLAEEPGAPTAYGGAGSKDGSIPGKMWINLRTTDLHRKFDVPTLVHHETIPGHVWEGEYSNQLPLIRSILAFNAFSEGWALYAEQLADELGAYDENPAWRLGYLQDQAFRACRLVVDTGLHRKRWTREQGISFFMERNGNKRSQVESEVDRYCSWPGQACGYKVGHSEIVRLRARAQQAMGPRYDLRGFNDAVVKGGNSPLDVLAHTVDRYINGKA
ncbi:MAG TPA: DUF885 domain-containing protein [Croceibacterium sp.]|nr:DUF885 domain-containing protein [Croceibacterium sp.]